MKLKTRLLLATSLTVLVILAAAEWASYQHTASFLKEHALFMLSDTRTGIEDPHWHSGRQTLMEKLAALHIFHAGATLVALVLVLNLVWRRFFLSPLQDLLSAINSMSRGNWDRTIETQRADEMGELTRAFNRLGLQLTFTVRQFAAASKLSAMALMGNSLSNKLMAAREQIHAAGNLLQPENADSRLVIAPVLRKLEMAIRALDDVRDEFDAEFERQFQRHAASPGRGIEDRPRDS